MVWRGRHDSTTRKQRPTLSIYRNEEGTTCRRPSIEAAVRPREQVSPPTFISEPGDIYSGHINTRGAASLCLTLSSFVHPLPRRCLLVRSDKAMMEDAFQLGETSSSSHSDLVEVLSEAAEREVSTQSGSYYDYAEHHWFAFATRLTDPWRKIRCLRMDHPCIRLQS